MKSKINTFSDNRGKFIPYNLEGWDQMNISINEKVFTFRGLHYQTKPYQTKLVKVIQGKVLDFLYDIKSGVVEVYELDQSNDLLVTSNFAHGFLTLEPNTIFTYLVSGDYNPKSEYSIVWDTIPEIKSIINYTVRDNKLTISEKDKVGK